MIQADLAELEILSRRLGTCSHEVDDLKTALTTLINTTTWKAGSASGSARPGRPSSGRRWTRW